MSDLQLGLLSAGCLLGVLAVLSFWMAVSLEDRDFKPFKKNLGTHQPLSYHLETRAHKRAPRAYERLQRALLFVFSLLLGFGSALCLVGLLRAGA